MKQLSGSHFMPLAKEGLSTKHDWVHRIGARPWLTKTMSRDSSKEVRPPLFTSPAYRRSAARYRPGRNGFTRSSTTGSGSSASASAGAGASTLVAATTGANSFPPSPRRCWLCLSARSCSTVKASSAAPMASPTSIACGRHGAPEAFPYAFDLLELDGRDLRTEP